MLSKFKRFQKKRVIFLFDIRNYSSIGTSYSDIIMGIERVCNVPLAVFRASTTIGAIRLVTMVLGLLRLTQRMCLLMSCWNCLRSGGEMIM